MTYYIKKTHKNFRHIVDSIRKTHNLITPKVILFERNATPENFLIVAQLVRPEIITRIYVISL